MTGTQHQDGRSDGTTGRHDRTTSDGRLAADGSTQTGGRRSQVGLAARIASSVRPTDSTHRVTTLELFFDLVFVFAFTQVTAFVADDLSATGLFRGLLLTALLWWAWCSYSWLGNQAQADEGVVRAAMVVAMGAMLVAALAIPEAWVDLPGGLDAPVALAVALGVVRSLHLIVYAVAAHGDTGLLRQLTITACPVGTAAALLVAGAVVGGAGQTALWVLALAVDYAGIYVAGVSGWRLPSPQHFAERYGLIVIVALGESLIAIGVGVAQLPLSWAIVAGSVLGLAVSVALWWLYFDVAALRVEHELHRLEGAQRTALARDCYVYLHFPMILGVLAVALGLKKVFEYVADVGHHDFTDALPGVAAVALTVGPAMYVLALAGFRYRGEGVLNRARLAAGLVLAALAAVATVLPALASLALVAATLVALVSYEARDAATRAEVRRTADTSPG